MSNLAASDYSPPTAQSLLLEGRALFLHEMAQIARRSGIYSQTIVNAYMAALTTAYDELVAARRVGFERTGGLTASRLVLMCDHDLEYEIRVGEITRRLAVCGGNALWRTQKLYMGLLGRNDMVPADNPVGPEVIGRGLWAVCHAGGGMVASLAMLDRLEEQLTLALPDLYRALNELLSTERTDLLPLPVAPRGGLPAAVPNLPKLDLDARYRHNALAALQNELRRRSAKEPVFWDASASNTVPDTSARPSFDRLFGRLDATALSAAAANALPCVVRSQDFKLERGRPEAIAVDTMALVFETIFASRRLPDAVKKLIGRLQIPLLKAAISDASLFSNHEHPARLLLNGMARATLGLPRNTGLEHTICARLVQLTDALANTSVKDASSFREPLAQLERLIAERDRAEQAEGKAYVPLVVVDAVREQAALAAMRWVQFIERQKPRAELLGFFRDSWRRVMENAFVEGGDGGRAWQECHATAVDLLWSVQPKTSSDDRKMLVGMVRTLIQRIGDGLNRIDCPADQRTAFLDLCYCLQTAALGGVQQPPAEVVCSPALSEGSAVRRLLVDLREVDGLQLKTLSFAAAPQVTPLAQRASAPVGAWVQFEMNDSDPLCGLVCWRDPSSDGTLLFNSEWGYAVVLASGVLGQLQQDGRATVVSSQSILDTVAQRALLQLLEK